MKTCTLCGAEKPLDDFYRWKNTADGRMARCKPCHRNSLASRAGSCEDCGGRVSHDGVKKCQRCRALAKRGAGSPTFKGGRLIKNGYVYLSGYQNHPNALKGKIFEHTLVMSAHLGRALHPGETVHHKNGIRDDNRLENLELWTRRQPPGQRVEDRVAWAVEILQLYRPDLLA